jgi:hypothetical protein
VVLPRVIRRSSVLGHGRSSAISGAGRVQLRRAGWIVLDLTAVCANRLKQERERRDSNPRFTPAIRLRRGPSAPQPYGMTLGTSFSGSRGSQDHPDMVRKPLEGCPHRPRLTSRAARARGLDPPSVGTRLQHRDLRAVRVEEYETDAGCGGRARAGDRPKQTTVNQGSRGARPHRPEQESRIAPATGRLAVTANLPTTDSTSALSANR